MAFQEYEHLFSAEQELAWLPHVERRYAWLKRHLLAFEEGVGSVLPRDWRLSRRIAAHFCQVGGAGGGRQGEGGSVLSPADFQRWKICLEQPLFNE